MQSSQLLNLRRLFLGAIREHTPKVLMELRGVYVAAEAIGRGKNVSTWAAGLDHWAEANSIWEPNSGAGTWLWLAGCRTLRYWNDNQEEVPRLDPRTQRVPTWSPDAADLELSAGETEELRKLVDNGLLQLPSDIPFRFEHRPWMPTESCAQFLDSLHEALAVRLEEYVEILLANIACPELGKPLKKHELKKHVEWLVLYHFKRCSLNTIARDFDIGTPEKPDASTVGKSIREAAELLIGPLSACWLRPPRPAGRRRDRPRFVEDFEDD